METTITIQGKTYRVTREDILQAAKSQSPERIKTYYVELTKVSRFSVWGQLWQRQHAKFPKTSQFAMNYVHLPGRFSTHVPLLGLSSGNRETFVRSAISTSTA